MSDTPTPTAAPLQKWCCLAYLFIGAALFAHLALMASALWDVLEAISEQVSPHDAGTNLRVATGVNLAVHEATYVAFLLLAWIAAAWISQNDRLAPRRQ